MAGFENTVFDDMLDTFSACASEGSIHTSDPGSTGDEEVSGGDYSRQALNWASASGGSVSVSSTVTFDIPVNTTVTHLGFWDSAETWLGSIELSEAGAFVGAGTLDVEPLTVPLRD